MARKQCCKPAMPDCVRCIDGLAASQLLLTVPDATIDPYDPFGDPSETCAGLCDDFIGEFVLDFSEDLDLKFHLGAGATNACVWKGPEFLGCDPLNPSSSGYPEPNQLTFFYAALPRKRPTSGTPNRVVWEVYLIYARDEPNPYNTASFWSYTVTNDPDELIDCEDFDHELEPLGASSINGCAVPGANVGNPVGNVFLETSA